VMSAAEIKASVELPRIARAGGKAFVVPESDKIFRFQCSGEIGGDSQLAGKRVEWKANFDRPLEELIYPSLQRFDPSYFERKLHQRKLKQTNDMYGSSKVPVFKPSQAALDAEAQGLLEPIAPSLVPTNEEIVYINTPKWTVRVMDAHLDQSVGNKSPHKDSVVEHASVTAAVAPAVVDDNASVNTTSTNNVSVSRTLASTSKASKHQQSSNTMNLSGSSTHGATTDTTGVAGPSGASAAGTISGTFLGDNKRALEGKDKKDVQFNSLIDEIEQQGEAYLRQRMMASIQEREEERRHKEKLAQNFLLGLGRRVAVELPREEDLTPTENAKLLVSYFLTTCVCFVTPFSVY
jgi:hypothetical protein